ncbi:uncharacterized protein LOC123516133 isoform X2 [Portunus trituberculatus]|uniref:uncharacterized protein LOC123516133 isoform X2 n=1 Tax=Portunus trituberculatus TaxID=210409 RepID=UPI001E1CDDAA|nr:uncharacterized protein LOC123516133 isoform X2 [Portunus trituberculatus]
MKPLLILGMLAATGGRCLATGNTSCNQGWELCPSTHQCVHKQCMNLIAQESESHECQDGQVFCKAMEACVQPCFTSYAETCSPNSPVSPVCPSGHVCCQKDASKTCTTPEDCQKSAGLHLPSPTCPDGYVFCLSVGGCVEGSCPDVSVGGRCEGNRVFCPSLGRCVTQRECFGTNVIEEAAFTCPPGKPLCLATGKCEEPWACSESLGTSRGEICPPHKPVFCLASRTCEVAGGCSSRPPETMARICPREYIYCAQRGECVARSRGCSDSGVRKPLLSCPHGTTFSIPSGTCVPDSENSQTLGGEKQACPSGSVFSLSSSKCVPDPTRERKKVACPAGTVYHLTEGTCVPDPVMYEDTPSWSCPMSNESRKDSFPYSTCITSDHCSNGLSCCPDPETWHFQCVNTVGEPDPSALNKTCLQLDKPKHDTALRCNNPNECPQASVCCGGKCRSHDGVATCPIGTLFCPASNACVRLGNQCGKICPPKHVLCSPSSDCAVWSSCRSDNYMSGAPWMMPDIKWVSALSNNSNTRRDVLLSETFRKAGSGSQDRSIVIFIITNFTSAYGNWYFRRHHSTPWIPLELTSEITPAHYLQYRPLPNLYEFGLDYINMTEAGTGIDRTVVQLIAPESPSIQMKKVVSTITTEEDVPKEFSLWSIINVTCNDTHYWRVWMQAADFPKQAAKASLLQFNSKNVILWVTLLQSPGLQNDIGEDGVMGRGLKLEWVKNSAFPDEVLADLYISLSEGKEWFRMNPRKALKLPIVSCEKVQDIMVKVQPTLNAYGTSTLRPSVYPSTSSMLVNDSTNMPDDADMNDIVLEVTSVNDLPVAKTYPEYSKIPALRVDKLNNGVPVETYAEAFFQDPENSALGIIILQALSGPDDDKWQYSVDDGKTFIDIMDLQENPFNIPFSTQEGRQGPVHWRKEIERVSCNFRGLINNIDNLSSLSNDKCLTEARKRMGRKLGATTSNSFNTRMKTQTMDTAGIAEFGYTGTGSLSLTGPETKRKVLYLPSNTVLRYNTSRSPWTKEEGFRDTRLVFVILDGNGTDQSLREVQWMNISLKEDLGKNGIGRDPVVTAMTWQDCTNQTLEMYPPRTVDACGQCGGNNSTCTDCAGVLNGDAKMVCGECVGGTTNKVREKDCAGQCEMKNHLVNIDGEEKCLANRTFCDGSLTSGAYYDRCGICVGGTTRQEINEAMDECGVCYGENTCFGCDNVPHSGKVMDRCGLCLKPDSPLFNNCLTLTATTEVLDAAVNDIADVDIQSRASVSRGRQDSMKRQLQSLLTIKAQVTGLTGKRYKVECWLEADSEQISNATHVQYAKGQLKATFKILLSGIQSFKCTFTPAKKKITSGMTLESETKVEVMDSRSAMVETDTTLVETSTDKQVNVTLKYASSVDFARCFLLYQDPEEGREKSIVVELDTEVLADDKVACTITRFTRPGEAQLGVALTPTAVKAMYLNPLNIQTKRITILSPAPEVISAVLNPYGDVLVIKFDKEIEFDRDCSNIILWPWTTSDNRQDPTCQILGSKVKVRLSPDISIEGNTTLNFTIPGSIRSANGDPSTAPSASGSFMVVQPKEQKEITFHLSGDTRACNTSEVTVIISRIRGAKIKDLEPEWNITWEPSPRSQAETVLVWQSLNNLKDAMKEESVGRRFFLRLPGNEFLEGVEYMINVHLKLTNGELTSAKSLTVTTLPSDQALRVTVSGPTMVLADQPNSYQATVTSCSDTMIKKDTKYKYVWTVLGSRALNVFQGKRITLPAGVLIANQNQTLMVSVKALGQEATGTTSLNLSVIPQGISVVTSASYVRVCSSTAIIVDASNSKDRDNRPGSLSFMWKCSSNVSSPCIVIGKPLSGLESALSEEEMRKPTLKIPAGYLPPGRYTLTVVVNKGRSSAQKNVEIEILRSACEVTVETNPTAVLVNPLEEVIIPAYVTGPPKLNIEWQSIKEPGFHNIEMMSFVDTGQPTLYEDASEHRQHFLQLPKPKQQDFTGLIMGETYKFRLKAWTDVTETIFSDIILRTPYSQLEGKTTLEVSPSAGSGILDNFTFTMKYSVDSIKDQPSSVYFGYRLQDSQDIWFTPITNENPVAVYQLPARSNQEKVTPLMKVCDPFGICQNEEGDIITLTLPSQLPPGLLGNLVNSFDNDMRCDECLKSALKKITDNLATIFAMNYSTTAAAALTEAIEMSIISELPNLITRTQNNPALSLDILEGLLGFVQEFGASPELQQLWGTLAWESFSQKFGLPSPDIRYSPAEISDKENEEFIYYPKTDGDLKDARNGYKSQTSQISSADANNQPIKQRVKRQAAAAGEEKSGYGATSKEKDRKPMTVNEAEIYLQTFETMVTEASPDTAKSHLKNLLDSLPLMLSGLCLLKTAAPAPKEVTGDLVSITVASPDLKDQEDKKFFLMEKSADRPQLVQKNNYVVFGDVLLDYDKWSCKKRGASENMSCYGACPSTVLLKDNFWSLVTGARTPGPLRTSVAGAFLLSPESGIKVPVTSDARILYSIKIHNTTKSPGYRIECFGWSDQEWDNTVCSTGITEIFGKVRKLVCTCKETVYVAGFLVKFSITPRIIGPSIEEEPADQASDFAPLPIKDKVHVIMIIHADYDEVVGKNKTALEEEWTVQISETLGIPKSSIYNLTISKGSVVVQFDILPTYTRTASKPPSDVFGNLYELVNSGTLTLTGLSNEQLPVLPQALDGSGPLVEEKKDPTKLPLIIGAVVGAIVLIVIVFICFAIYFKNKKKMDKVQPLQMGDTKQPTYSSIYFEQMLDGTIASLAKQQNSSNRSLSSGGSYADEGIYIERRATPSSRGGSGSKSSANLSHDSGLDEVPEPFQYNSPSKEQLESSGAIPEHIDYGMCGIRLGHALPGKPDYLLFEEVAERKGSSAGNTSRRHAMNDVTPS